MLKLFSWQCLERLMEFFAMTQEGMAVSLLFANKRQLCFSCWNALPYGSKTHLRIWSVPCHVPHSFWTLCSSAWVGRRKKLSTIMTVLVSVVEKVNQRRNQDSNIHLHLSQFLASAVRCDSEDIPVKELRRRKTSLLKLNQEAHI